MYYISSFFSEGLKFFFLLTPFFVLSMFISCTQDYDERARKLLALRVITAVFIVCTTLFFFGNLIFKVFDITLDAFRIGGGTLLFLSAVTLVNGAAAHTHPESSASENSDIAVVPLAIPVTVGPATTGALLIMGAEPFAGGIMTKVVQFLGLMTAVALLGVFLYCSTFLERILKKRGIVILSKLTGLILSALAAQMIFTGICAFLRPLFQQGAN